MPLGTTGASPSPDKFLEKRRDVDDPFRPDAVDHGVAVDHAARAIGGERRETPLDFERERFDFPLPALELLFAGRDRLPESRWQRPVSRRVVLANRLLLGDREMDVSRLERCLGRSRVLLRPLFERESSDFSAVSVTVAARVRAVTRNRRFMGLSGVCWEYGKLSWPAVPGGLSQEIPSNSAADRE